MSKYIYTTIYEQFTGLKPPEPKDQKPRRRRGYGHPYRMRLNMQDASVQDSELLSSGNEDPDMPRDAFEQPPVSIFQPTVKPQSVRRFSSGNQGYRSPSSSGNVLSSRNAFPEEPVIGNSNSEPKVTYKKRRQYGSSSFSFGAMGRRNGNDNTDY
ncbi:hypothetical protein [uncultured Endozoicomonas sp.]|uniref:hypothetical protein n=1 Tax=uncultured Endozoicomonas sp. TaxID=432652 RepID=UPI00262D20AA|nr:hypothetical protein [uncultured Endozoicomonas sp.]